MISSANFFVLFCIRSLLEIINLFVSTIKVIPKSKSIYKISFYEVITNELFVL